jgi:hypothetical protein
MTVHPGIAAGGHTALSPRRSSLRFGRTHSQISFHEPQRHKHATAGLWKHKVSEMMRKSSISHTGQGEPATPKLLQLLRKPGAEPGLDIKKFKYADVNACKGLSGDCTVSCIDYNSSQAGPPARWAPGGAAGLLQRRHTRGICFAPPAPLGARRRRGLTAADAAPMPAQIKVHTPISSPSTLEAFLAEPRPAWSKVSAPCPGSGVPSTPFVARAPLADGLPGSSRPARPLAAAARRRRGAACLAGAERQRGCGRQMLASLPWPMVERWSSAGPRCRPVLCCAAAGALGRRLGP